MNEMLKKNRNYEKTENSIKEALIKLANQKQSLSAVTVKDICKLANLSRSTFYLHYADIESIFESVGNKFLNTFSEMMKDLTSKKPEDFSIYIKEVFKFINESNDLIKIGLKLGDSLSYFINQIKRHLELLVSNSPILYETKIDKQQLLIESKIVASGIIDLIIDLLKNNDKYNEAKFTKHINEFLNRWVATLT
jgi:AcrR family transcriptional regulator